MVTSASAADLAARPYTKAPPPMVAALYDWSGFYIGMNGGGAWSRKCWDIAPFTTVIIGGPAVTIPGGPEGCHTASGGTIGGQLGYRWQASSWVFGLEVEGNWADLTGSSVSTFPFFAGLTSNRSRIDAIGLFTGQIGYSWNQFLLYVKGGAAVTRDKYEGFTTATGVVLDRATETRWGGVIELAANTPSRTGRSRSNTTISSWGPVTSPTTRSWRRSSSRAPSTSVRTSIFSQPASTIAGAVRWLRNTDPFELTLTI